MYYQKKIYNCLIININSFNTFNQSIDNIEAWNLHPH